MSTPISNASDPGSRTTKRKNTRAASNLSSAQLERKRANDRESQRAIRARTKEHIARLEQEVRQLRSRDLDREFQHLLRCNEALEAELRHFRASVAMSCNRHAACPHRAIPHVSLPDNSGAGPFNRDSTAGRLQCNGDPNSGRVEQKEQYQHPSLLCLHVPRSAASTPQLPASTSAACSSIPPGVTNPASYVPAGYAAENILDSAPTATADLGALKVVDSAAQNAYQVPQDKGLFLTESARVNQEYAGAPFALTANTDMSPAAVHGRLAQQHLGGPMYLAGHGH